jgi:hypothetical protein
MANTAIIAVKIRASIFSRFTPLPSDDTIKDQKQKVFLSMFKYAPKCIPAGASKRRPKGNKEGQK